MAHIPSRRDFLAPKISSPGPNNVGEEWPGDLMSKFLELRIEEIVFAVLRGQSPCPASFDMGYWRAFFIERLSWPAPHVFFGAAEMKINRRRRIKDDLLPWKVTFMARVDDPGDLLGAAYVQGDIIARVADNDMKLEFDIVAADYDSALVQAHAWLENFKMKIAALEFSVRRFHRRVPELVDKYLSDYFENHADNDLASWFKASIR